MTSGYARGFANAASEALRLLGLLLLPGGDARRIYGLLGSAHVVGEQSLFMNLGYWAEPSVRTFDEASAALVDLVGRTAGLSGEDTVLDAGFGFGDQDLRWYEQYQPRSIIGVNITPLHVARARERVAARGLSDRIDLREGSATTTGLPAESVDKVLAVESAFHFDTREDFFREALRVLRPGGRLCAADIVPLPGRSFSYPVRSIWHVPKANLYPRDTYAVKLEAAGFRNVRVTSIREHVLEPHMRLLARRLDEPDLIARMNPLMRRASKSPGYNRDVLESFDYVLAVAEK
ncbi:MAG TPA: methyltransferase domain-containing protein [Archangium sp.]|jgi:cyclopropane fatty-acyl-phospholipid synthase-like methyltransferase|uniref:methyltransferase domain-containing protein n=1 Tax=Archangium sp. TaxID=1872627 RepID=UPI002ED8463C